MEESRAVVITGREISCNHRHHPVLGLVYGLVGYQAKNVSPSPSGDRNVPEGDDGTPGEACSPLLNLSCHRDEVTPVIDLALGDRVAERNFGGRVLPQQVLRSRPVKHFVWHGKKRHPLRAVPDPKIEIPAMPSSR